MSGVVHGIPVTSGMVVRIPLQLINPWSLREAIAKEMEPMLHLGVIEESTSSWRSAPVLVLKPDGSIRFCNDFQRVKAVSESDAYQISGVEQRERA